MQANPEQICAICLCQFQPNELKQFLQCGHFFHCYCIEKWGKSQGNVKQLCPICRNKIILTNNSQRLLDRESSDTNPQAVENRTLSEWIAKFAFIAISLAAQAVILYFTINELISLFSNIHQYPILSVGKYAKGIFAIGVYANGIFCLGMVSIGVFTITQVGIGLLFVIGQVGGGFGFGIFQVGICGYVYFCQLGIGVWKTKGAQLGVSVISPLINRNEKDFVQCQC